MAYHTQRTIATLAGRFRLHLTVRRCPNSSCPRYHQPYRPEAEGSLALPHGEYGLDVITLVGLVRYRHHHSLAELHRVLRDRGLSIGERTVLNLLARYEELVSLHLSEPQRLQRIQPVEKGEKAELDCFCSWRPERDRRNEKGSGSSLTACFNWLMDWTRQPAGKSADTS